MLPIYNQIEFDTALPDQKIQLECHVCKNIFLRKKGYIMRVGETGGCLHCSPKCSYKQLHKKDNNYQ